MLDELRRTNLDRRTSFTAHIRDGPRKYITSMKEEDGWNLTLRSRSGSEAPCTNCSHNAQRLSSEFIATAWFPSPWRPNLISSIGDLVIRERMSWTHRI